MKIINYISTISIPIIIAYIIIYGIKEKIKVYDVFIEGAKEGIDIVIKIFPTLLAIFLAIGMLRNSGIIEYIIKAISSITYKINFPVEITPLILLRPISGSASLGIATDIMKNFGVDSKIGKIASTIMGSTETVFYTIAIYASSVKIKKTRFVLAAALIADAVGIVVSVVLWNFLS